MVGAPLLMLSQSVDHAPDTKPPMAMIKPIATAVIMPIRIEYSIMVAPLSSLRTRAKRPLRLVIFMLLKRGLGSVGPSFFFGSGPATLHVNDRPELRREKPAATHEYLGKFVEILQVIERVI